MLKRLSILLLLVSFSHADYTIKQAHEDTLTIEKTNWPIGTSGIVIHKINDQHETILSRVEVISNENQTELKILPFNDLQQEALPTLKTTPTEGDRVRLGWMHERVLLIAPNKKSYNLVIASQKDQTFINSDLFAASISKEGHPSPLKEDFQNFCLDYDIGVIQIIVGKKIFKVDAYSFKVLATIEVDFPEVKAELPFYSLIDDIHADMWGEGSDEIKDYNGYYLSLLGEN